MIFRLLVALQLGHSLTRILMNEAVRSIELDGEVVDFGGGKKPAAYIKYFQTGPNFELKTVDRDPTRKPDIVANLEEGIPVNNASCDSVLMMNLLEHTYNYSNVISEAQRLLRPGGKLVGSVPFLYPVHPYPNRIYPDYFRYTDQALTKLLADHGFKEIEIKPVQIGPTTTGFFLAERPWVKITKWVPLLRIISYLVVITIDLSLFKLRQYLVFKTKQHEYVLCYVFQGRKR